MSSTDRPFGVPGASGDDQPPSAGTTDKEEIAAAKAANRFDIRRLIGGLFVVYAVILIASGVFGSHQVKNKAAGINIDLYTGLGMLVFGGLMIFWALSRPTTPEPPETRGQGSGRIRRAPAT
jgi:hypothetical protein